jgi:manganese/zinc/iron transport system ATP- binding protein
MQAKANGETVLDVHDVTVAYDRQPVLWDVDWTLREPALVAIVGRTGLARAPCSRPSSGLVPLLSGEVRLFGQPVSRVRPRVAYVPQRESVGLGLPGYRVRRRVDGDIRRLGWFRRPSKAERDLARRCLEQLGLSGLENRQIGELSGGQQQRLFLARALAQQAEIYLMDEPLAGVDAATERVFWTLLQELRQQNRTVIVVHHDLRSVPERFEQVVLLNTRIIASGPTQEVFTPENLQRTYGGRLMILEEAGQLLPRTRRP